MNFKLLIAQIEETHNILQQSAVKAVNSHQTVRNWLIGRYIFEYEQNGEDRARYGKLLLKKVSERINADGISETNLKLFRQFYLVYPQIGQTVSDQFSQFQISQTLSDQLKILPAAKTLQKKISSRPVPAVTVKSMESIAYWQKLVSSIPFSHFTELLKINDGLKRKYYELLTIKQVLSYRELKRQIHALSFERLALSANKSKALAQIEKSIKPQKAQEVIKDFYFFEFLQLPNKETLQESSLEKALLDHLEKFILELGNGFCFEARQKRIFNW